MRIGIDLDDVVFEFAKTFLKYSNKELGKKILFEDIFSYDFSKVFRISRKRILNLLENFSKEIGRAHV